MVKRGWLDCEWVCKLLVVGGRRRRGIGRVKGWSSSGVCDTSVGDDRAQGSRNSNSRRIDNREGNTDGESEATF